MTEQFRIEIIQDQDPMSPREWDNIATMVCYHKRYKLGDISFNPNDYSSWLAVRKNLIPSPAIALPLYLYDHGGITISTERFSCPWDSGQVGWIYVTHKKLREEFHYQRIGTIRQEKAKQILRAEVDTYDQYLRGDIWTYEIYNFNDELVDSCHGFYGEETARREAEDCVSFLMTG